MPNSPTQQQPPDRPPRGRLTGLVLILLVGLVSLPALLTARLTWVPVEATVVETRIAQHRPGNLEWTLEVDLTYEVDGVEYQRSALRILDDRYREEAVARLPEWPTGRTLTIYHDLDRPQRVSLAEDGGLEATIVLTVMFALVVVAVSTPFVIAGRRAKARRARGAA